MCYLSDQDVVKFDSIKGSLNVLYRRNSRHNSFLVTERCNNYCLMCSQPPREIDDSYIIADILEALPLISRETKELGLTGGEPTLLGDDLIKIIQTSKNYLPSTGIHILSNGRNFSNLSYAEKLARIDHHDLMVGIPLYSDISNIHDFVVQADGAYDETIRGIMNLKKYRQKVEIRIVIHQQTYKRLPELAEFITRNLLFVDHIALMGLEMMGFTKHNIDKLWIDPKEYQEELLKAVKILDRFKMNISIYNHQLCLLNKRLWRFNKKSISDWKNEYMPECEGCLEKEQCGGFFSSAKFKYSDSIKPFKED
jgi:His-Xaa-Ser system radical SAM maturase HxsC